MAKKIYSMFAMFGLLLALAVVSAQAKQGEILEVNIPFDFQVGGKTLPAGEYAVKQLSDKALLIRSADGKAQTIIQSPGRVQANVSETGAKQRLVFHQYGDQFFLSQVWMTTDGDGRELNRSNAERRAASGQTLVTDGQRVRKVEVAARAR